MALMDLAVGSMCLCLSSITVYAVHLKPDHILECGLGERIHWRMGMGATGSTNEADNEPLLNWLVVFWSPSETVFISARHMFNTASTSIKTKPQIKLTPSGPTEPRLPKVRSICRPNVLSAFCANVSMPWWALKSSFLVGWSLMLPGLTVDDGSKPADITSKSTCRGKGQQFHLFQTGVERAS